MTNSTVHHPVLCVLYSYSSVFYWPLLLPTSICGFGDTATHFISKVTFAKLSAFHHDLFCFLVVYYEVALDTPFVPGCTHWPCCTLLEFVLHLVTTTQPLRVCILKLCLFSSSSYKYTFLTQTRNTCASNQKPAIYNHLQPSTALYCPLLLLC